MDILSALEVLLSKDNLFKVSPMCVQSNVQRSSHRAQSGNKLGLRRDWNIEIETLFRHSRTLKLNLVLEHV